MGEIKVNYGYTKNLGNYESERLDASETVTLRPGDNIEEALLNVYQKLRAFVTCQLRLNPEKEDYSESILRRRSSSEIRRTKE